MLGMLGVGSGVLASLLAVGFSPETLTQFGGLAALGSIAGMVLPGTGALTRWMG